MITLKEGPWQCSLLSSSPRTLPLPPDEGVDGKCRKEGGGEVSSLILCNFHQSHYDCLLRHPIVETTGRKKRYVEYMD